MTSEKSLREQILTAQSKEEIQTLLSWGEEYKYAKPQTKRQWQKAAALRVQQLAQEPDSDTVANI